MSILFASISFIFLWQVFFYYLYKGEKICFRDTVLSSKADINFLMSNLYIFLETSFFYVCCSSLSLELLPALAWFYLAQRQKKILKNLSIILHCRRMVQLPENLFINKPPVTNEKRCLLLLLLFCTFTFDLEVFRSYTIDNFLLL